MRPDHTGAARLVVGTMIVAHLGRRPSAWLPVVMSLAAVGMVAWQLATYGTMPQPDETAQVRLWQLLLAGQLPVIAWFAARWLPRAPRPGAIILALQLGAIAVAVVAVALLDGL